MKFQSMEMYTHSRMKIQSINLRNFRNIGTFNESFHPHLNIFVGHNGHGKTNVIESLVYLSSGRSFRVNQDMLLVKEGEEHAKIEAKLDQDETISVVLSNEGKYMMYNDKNITKLSDFIGICNVVLFQPDDLQFYTQAPRKRRKDIDYELGKSSKTYLHNLARTTKLVQDRNAYLKQHKQDEVYLEILDQQIAELSEYIIIKRLEFVNFISKSVHDYYQKFTDSKDDVKFTYESCIDLNKDNYRSALLQRMKEHRQRDLDLKMTNVGIHREDFIFKINDVDVTHMMSQGQRRILMIAYKLSVIDWFMKHDEITPVFCMDDLFSELDEEKRQIILDNLNKDLQIFITTTDLTFIKTQKDKYIFEIENGRARRA